MQSPYAIQRPEVFEMDTRLISQSCAKLTKARHSATIPAMPAIEAPILSPKER